MAGGREWPVRDESSHSFPSPAKIRDVPGGPLGVRAGDQVAGGRDNWALQTEAGAVPYRDSPVAGPYRSFPVRGRLRPLQRQLPVLLEIWCYHEFSSDWCCNIQIRKRPFVEFVKKIPNFRLIGVIKVIPARISSDWCYNIIVNSAKMTFCRYYVFKRKKSKIRVIGIIKVISAKMTFCRIGKSSK